MTLEQAISKLRTERKPLDEKVAELKAKLEGELSESEFKDTKLTLEYYESKINKIRAKIEKLEKEKADLQTELEAIQHKEDIINCALDKYHLSNEVGNWQNRKGRAVERILKTLKDRDGLLTLRKNLNQRWKELTGDKEPLCEPLTLKNDSKIYFL